MKFIETMDKVIEILDQSGLSTDEIFRLLRIAKISFMYVDLSEEDQEFVDVVMDFLKEREDE